MANLRTGADVSTPVSTASGTFVLTVPARFGDTLELRYSIGGETDTSELELGDDLSELEPPGCLACVGILVSPPDASGNATVSLSELELADGLVVVFNSDNQASESAPTSSAGLDLAANVGDTVCAYEVDSTGRQSPASCALVPES